MAGLVPEKLGEVLAFTRAGLDTLQEAEQGFLKIIDRNTLDDMETSLIDLEKKIHAYAEKAGVMSDVDESESETAKKLSQMRDTYLGGKSDEADDVLEWSGLYAGGAIVHWQLLYGAAASLEDDVLLELANDGVTLYSTFFSSDEKMLRAYGAKHAG